MHGGSWVVTYMVKNDRKDALPWLYVDIQIYRLSSI